MKKLFLLFLLLVVALGGIFQSCDNTKTYAEKMADERKAINKFIKDKDIKVISVEEFEKDTITAENEFVLFPASGVYLNIVDRGEGRAPQNRDIISTRFEQYYLLDEGWDEPMISNVQAPRPEIFTYMINSSSLYGPLSADSYNIFYNAYGTGLTAVAPGWLVALQYVKNNAHIKLIVPHKYGDDYAMQYVFPFYYEITKFQIYE